MHIPTVYTCILTGTEFLIGAVVGLSCAPDGFCMVGCTCKWLEPLPNKDRLLLAGDDLLDITRPEFKCGCITMAADPVVL